MGTLCANHTYKMRNLSRRCQFFVLVYPSNSKKMNYIFLQCHYLATINQFMRYDDHTHDNNDVLKLTVRIIFMVLGTIGEFEDS